MIGEIAYTEVLTLISTAISTTFLFFGDNIGLKKASIEIGGETVKLGTKTSTKTFLSTMFKKVASSSVEEMFEEIITDSLIEDVLGGAIGRLTNEGFGNFMGTLLTSLREAISGVKNTRAHVEQAASPIIEAMNDQARGPSGVTRGRSLEKAISLFFKETGMGNFEEWSTSKKKFHIARFQSIMYEMAAEANINLNAIITKLEADQKIKEVSTIVKTFRGINRMMKACALMSAGGIALAALNHYYDKAGMSLLEGLAGTIKAAFNIKHQKSKPGTIQGLDDKKTTDASSALNKGTQPEITGEIEDDHDEKPRVSQEKLASMEPEKILARVLDKQRFSTSLASYTLRDVLASADKKNYGPNKVAHLLARFNLNFFDLEQDDQAAVVYFSALQQLTADNIAPEQKAKALKFIAVDHDFKKMLDNKIITDALGFDTEKLSAQKNADEQFSKARSEDDPPTYYKDCFKWCNDPEGRPTIEEAVEYMVNEFEQRAGIPSSESQSTLDAWNRGHQGVVPGKPERIIVKALRIKGQIIWYGKPIINDKGETIIIEKGGQYDDYYYIRDEFLKYDLQQANDLIGNPASSFGEYHDLMIAVVEVDPSAIEGHNREMNARNLLNRPYQGRANMFSPGAPKKGISQEILHKEMDKWLDKCKEILHEAGLVDRVYDKTLWGIITPTRLKGYYIANKEIAHILGYSNWLLSASSYEINKYKISMLYTTILYVLKDKVSNLDLYNLLEGLEKIVHDNFEDTDEVISKRYMSINKPLYAQIHDILQRRLKTVVVGNSFAKLCGFDAERSLREDPTVLKYQLLKTRYRLLEMKHDLTALFQQQDIGSRITISISEAEYDQIIADIDKCIMNYILKEWISDDVKNPEARLLFDLLWNVYVMIAQRTGLEDQMSPDYMKKIFQTFSFNSFPAGFTDITLNNVIKKLKDKTSSFPEFEGLQHKWFTILQREDILFNIVQYALKSQFFDYQGGLEGWVISTLQTSGWQDPCMLTHNFIGGIIEVALKDILRREEGKGLITQITPKIFSATVRSFLGCSRLPRMTSGGVEVHRNGVTEAIDFTDSVLTAFRKAIYQGWESNKIIRYDISKDIGIETEDLVIKDMYRVLRSSQYLNELAKILKNPNSVAKGDAHELGVNTLRQQSAHSIASEVITLIENFEHTRALVGHIDNLLGLITEEENIIYIADHKPSHTYHCNADGALHVHFFSHIPQLIAYYQGLRYLIQKFHPEINLGQLTFKCIIYNENDIIEFDPEVMLKEMYGYYVSFIVNFIDPKVVVDVAYVREQLEGLAWWDFFPLSNTEIAQMIEKYF